MAQTATIHNLTIDLSDIDRSVYETLEIRVARQPSETAEYMLVRVLAYCLEYRDGITLTGGVAAGNEPAVLVRDLTGRITAWIEVGMPEADRLHRGMKLAGKAAVYTHRDARKLVAQLAEARVYKAAEIPVHAFNRDFIETLAALIEKRSAFSMSITEGEIYINMDGREFTTIIAEHRIGPG